MLPWWFWVLLWTVLILATLLLAVLAGFRLFRRAMSVLDGASGRSEVGRFFWAGSAGMRVSLRWTRVVRTLVRDRLSRLLATRGGQDPR